MKKVGVVGFGFMGITHALNILKTEGLELAAIVEKDPALIEQNLRANLGNFATGEVSAAAIRRVPVFTSMEDCLEKVDVEALHICVHTRLHYALAKKALESGRSVLVEKPFTLDVAQGRELIDLARRRGLVLMVAHVVRFMPAYRRLKDWIDSRTFGEIDFLSLTRFSGLPAWGEWKSDHAVRAASGGALFDLLIHDIDFLAHAMGEPAAIDALSLPGRLSDHDYVSARWRFANERRLAVIEGGDMFHVRLPFESRYVARFANASVSYSSLEPRIVHVAGDETLERVEVGDPADGYLNEIRYFGGCLEDNRWPEACSPESALRSIELCYRHIQNRKEAKL
jgi:predicted dehydrogenase